MYWLVHTKKDKHLAKLRTEMGFTADPGKVQQPHTWVTEYGGSYGVGAVSGEKNTI